jgi:hypothetical protein
MLGVALFSSNASAAVVNFGGYSGEVRMKFINFDEGTVYVADDGEYGAHGGGGVGDLDALPQLSPVGGVANEDGWGVFRIQEILDSTGLITFYNHATANFEITGIFYGIQDTYLKVTDAGTTDEQQEIHSNGLSADFWAGPKNFNPAGGPLARTSATTNPTATDGTLIWSLNAVPGWVAGDSDEFFSYFRPSDGGPGIMSSNGGFYGEWGATPGGLGVDNGQWLDPVGPDLESNFTGETGSFGWLLNSDDPFRATPAIPEPVTAAMSLLGLAGVALVALRRRSA